MLISDESLDTCYIFIVFEIFIDIETFKYLKSEINIVLIPIYGYITY